MTKVIENSILHDNEECYFCFITGTYILNNKFKLTIPLTIILTLIAIIYQRRTGPTYPKHFEIAVAEGSKTIMLLRSFGGEGDAPVLIKKDNSIKGGTIHFKRYPTNDPWEKHELLVTNSGFEFKLPHQPPAGKIQYYIELETEKGKQKLGDENDPIIIRFKGDVPTLVLAPHIFCMFISMLLSTLAGFEAFFKTKSVMKIALYTNITLITGGMILGPIVQKYAFGVYWAGFPFGYDLTDNKLLISVIFWILGFGLFYFKKIHSAIIVASIVLILMYAIPHSKMGSQFNYHKGAVETAR